MFLIGLTGGAATGKSTASGYFKELGVPVIDADEVAKLIVEPGQPAFNEIKATFGQEREVHRGKIKKRSKQRLVVSIVLIFHKTSFNQVMFQNMTTFDV